MSEEFSLHEVDPSSPLISPPEGLVELLSTSAESKDNRIPEIESPTLQEQNNIVTSGEPSNSEAHPALSSSNIVFDNYGAYRKYLEQEHFDLYGRLGSLPLGPDAIHATILDIGSLNAIDEASFSITRGQPNSEFRLALKNTNQTAGNIRIIIVEDINQAAVDILGGELDLDPTFFFNHIRGSTQDDEHGIDTFTVLASTKKTVQQESRVIDQIEYDRAKLQKMATRRGDGKLDSQLSKLDEERSRYLSSLTTCFVHTEPRDRRLQSYKSKYREGINKPYQSMDWNKVIVLNELQSGFDPNQLATYRDCFNPDVRDLREYNDTSNLGKTFLQSIKYHIVDPIIHKMLKERSLHSMMTERLSIYDLEIGQQATTIILCDPLPTHQDRTYYDLWQQRGSWFHEASQLSPISSRSQSTKDCFVSWFMEAFAKVSTGKTPVGSTLPFVLELIRRDTLTALEYVQLRTRRIQTEILSDESPENNIRVWREWLSNTFDRLARNAESLDELLSTYEDSTISEISTKKKWTSLSAVAQLNLNLPITYYLGGRAATREVVRGRKIMQPLLKKFELTQQTLQRTDDLLKNTISLKESQRAISEAHSVTKLTELAFIFIPLSFTTSFLSMPLDILNSSISLATFVTFALVVLSGAYVLRILVRASIIRRLVDKIQGAVRQESGLAPGQKIPNSAFFTFVLGGLYRYGITPFVLWTFSFIFALPTILIWALYQGNAGLRGGLTVLCFFLWLFVAISEKGHDRFENLTFAKEKLSSIFRAQRVGVIRLPDAASDERNVPRPILVIIWWLFRLCMIATSLIAPIIIIWVVLPSSTGSKIGLTAAVVLVIPFVWMALETVLMEQEAGQRIHRSIRWVSGKALVSIKLVIEKCFRALMLFQAETRRQMV